MNNWTVIIEQAAPLLLQGVGLTLVLAFSSAFVGLLGGTSLALLRSYQIPILGRLATVYIEFIRSQPLILFVIFVHYGLLPLVIQQAPVLLSAFVAFSLFQSAYLAEVIRGGLRSIRPQERESAVSLGLSTLQRLRFVELPLAFRRCAPALLSQLITLIKDTSLASIIGLIELTRAGEIIYEQTYQDFEILVIQAVIYLTLCLGLLAFGRRLLPKTQ